ncbi:MAG: cupin domain-containing protein [Caldilineaceae bacterium]|jgi:quercetin dioxygenase-like cupin family protein|nr:cupin domain-containing protein [Caldilineaceae bacterium]
MNGKFTRSAEMARDALDWGEMGWVSRPATTNAEQIVAIEVTFLPGEGHNFHKHPQQEEVIYVLAGEVEQWLEDEKQLLQAGDSIFIAPGVVHASFTVGSQPAKLLAILAPCTGADGYVAVDVGNETPWNGLR